MKRETPTQAFVKSGTLQLILAIASVATALLAVYISYRLAPLSTAVAVIKEQVRANESEHGNLAKESEITSLQADIRNIKSQVADLHRYYFGK